MNRILFPGTDADRVGVHLLECHSYEIAERWFREAIAVNPQEPHFRVHLAHSLYQQRRYSEAVRVLTEVLHIAPGFAPATSLLEWCKERVEVTVTPLAREGRRATDGGSGES